MKEGSGPLQDHKSPSLSKDDKDYPPEVFIYKTSGREREDRKGEVLIYIYILLLSFSSLSLSWRKFSYTKLLTIEESL